MLTVAVAAQMGTVTGVLPRAKNGDSAAFDELMRSHQRQVLAVAMRMTGNLDDAQDIAQDVFVRLYRNLRSLPDEDAVGRWLYRVTVNACTDASRRKRPERVLPLIELPSSEADPEAAMRSAEQKEKLQEALTQLGERERAALVLRDMEGLSTAEVAGVLGVAEATVRVQISKARLKLRDLLRGAR